MSRGAGVANTSLDCFSVPRNRRRPSRFRWSFSRYYDEKEKEDKSRKSNLQVHLPKFPAYYGSSESLSGLSPRTPMHSPHSPGPYINHEILEMGDKSLDSPAGDKEKSPNTLSVESALTRKESYKAQRKNYRREKKRVAKELLSALKDPSIIVLADWLKVRGTLKSWTKLWCVLKPGLLLLYKSPKAKSSHWVGTVLLNTCEVIERPSKKDGFCFKLFHPLEQSIWATRGPEGETIGAVVQPLPTSYLIFRAPSQGAGKCWMDALELVLRCSSLLMRSMSTRSCSSAPLNNEMSWNDLDYERHFKDHDLDDTSHTDEQPDVSRQEESFVADHQEHSLSDTETEEDSGGGEEEVDPEETPYLPNENEEFGGIGEQIEELPEENRSLIWFLVKQVRPGMDLSRVVLPTFILEPRSFLDKLSDYHYHADLLTNAVQEDDAFTRMKSVTQWYLSGFYKKPKGLKKPYNPVLGETFRCYWKHPSGSRTFYVSEQVSHHPPISAFHVTNRKEGFCISGTILAKSKFFGNSTSAILDGTARLTLLPRGEDYLMTMPYAHCKGILLGTLTMELGGKVEIECEKTGYKTEIEFKLKPLFGGSEFVNVIAGKIRLGKETLATIDGHWDGQIYIKDKRTEEQQVLWNPTPDVRMKRLKRYTVPLEHQLEFESERLWQHVTHAIYREDQTSATEEKTLLEEAQRNLVRERKAKCLEWTSRFFDQDRSTGSYMYKYADLRPWDPRNDVFQYECNYVVSTKTRHKTPVIRSGSIVSVDQQGEAWAGSNTLSQERALKGRSKRDSKTSGSSTAGEEGAHSDSSHSDHEKGAAKGAVADARIMQEVVRPIINVQKDMLSQLTTMQHTLQSLQLIQRDHEEQRRGINRDLVLMFVILVISHMIMMLLFRG